MDDDAQLLRRYAREGAEEAFAELVRRHLGLVYGSAVLRVNGNVALAEEVAQGVFVEVAREAERLAEKVGGGVALAGWLYVATRNAAANVVRAEGRRVRREQEAFVMSERGMDGGADGLGVGGRGRGGESDEAVWAEVRPELEAVMDELAEKDREAVLMRFFEGRAFGEIGAALRVSEDAARVRVNRALEKMRGLLMKRGVTSTAAALGGLLAGNAAVAAPVGLAASVTAGAVAAVGAALSVGAASAGVAGAGILSFMTTTKLVTGVACVVAAVAVGTAVYERNERRAAQEESARLASDARRLNRDLDEMRRLQREADARSKEESEAKAAAQKRAADERVEQTLKNAATQWDTLYSDSRYVEAMNRWAQTSIPFIYGPLYRRLGYSKDQIAQFEKAMMEIAESSTDFRAAGRAQGMSLDDKSLLRLEADAKRRGEESLRAVMGEEGYSAYKSFRKEGVVREPLDAFFVEALYQRAPFTAEQAERIVQASMKNKSETKTRTARGSLTTITYDWDAIQAEMGDLTPEQRSLLKAYAEMRRSNAEKTILFNELTNKGNAP